MIQFLYLVFGGVVTSVILEFIQSTTSEQPEVFAIMTGIAFIIFTIWIAVIINEIRKAITEQLDDFYSLETLTHKKSSYKKQMEVRQSDYIYSFSFFIPKSTRYTRSHI